MMQLPFPAMQPNIKQSSTNAVEAYGASDARRAQAPRSQQRTPAGRGEKPEAAGAFETLMARQEDQWNAAMRPAGRKRAGDPTAQNALDAASESTETPDLQAVSMLFAVPPSLAEPPAEPVSDPVPTGEAMLSQPDPVISVLEGNQIGPAEPADQNRMDMNLPAASDMPAPADMQTAVEQSPLPAPVAAEGPARMPQQTPSPSEMPAQPETAQAVTSGSGDLCPLENENDAGQQTGSDTGNPASDTAGGDKVIPFDKPETDAAAQGRLFPTQQTVDIAPEQMLSADQLAGVADAEAVPVTTDNLFDAMVERMEVAKAANNSSQMELQLKPDYLGKVTIQLSMTAGGVAAKIHTEDPSVRGLINGQIAQLVEALSDKGIKVAAMDVVYTAVADHSFAQNRPRQDAPQTGRSGRQLRVDGLADASPYVYQPDSVLTLDGGVRLIDTTESSVEFTA